MKVHTLLLPRHSAHGDRGVSGSALDQEPQTSKGEPVQPQSEPLELLGVPGYPGFLPVIYKICSRLPCVWKPHITLKGCDLCHRGAARIYPDHKRQDIKAGV